MRLSKKHWGRWPKPFQGTRHGGSGAVPAFQVPAASQKVWVGAAFPTHSSHSQRKVEMSGASQTTEADDTRTHISFDNIKPQ